MKRWVVYVGAIATVAILYFAISSYLKYEATNEKYEKLSADYAELQANQVVNMEYIDSRQEFKVIDNFLKAFYSKEDYLNQKEYLAELKKYAEEGVYGRLLGPGYVQEVTNENTNGQFTILNDSDIYMNENGRFLVRANISYELGGEVVAGPTEIVYSFTFNEDNTKLKDVVIIAAAEETE